MKRRPHYIATVMSLLLCFSRVAFSQSAPPDPKAILRGLVARYAGLSSYQDTGVVQMYPGESLIAANPILPRFLNVSSGGDTLVSFKTYFVRPRMFRFDWKSSFMPASREAVVWSDGKNDYSWMPSAGAGDDSFMLSDGADLSFHVLEAQRWSGGAIFLVPSLLMKDLDDEPFGEMLSSMTDLSLLRGEHVDGELCHVVSGKIDGTPWVLWVGKDSRLLRRTRTLYTTGSFHETLERGRAQTSIAEEIHRDIRINGKIPRKIFKYKPRLRADDTDLTH